MDSFCFPKKTKNPNPSPIGKKFGFCCCGAPPGTRTPGQLIKRSRCATIVNFQNHAEPLFLSSYREFAFYICCILCTCHPLLHPLSSRSGVQKVCKKCAKMCKAKISPLKQVSDFYSKFRACSSATRITLQSPSGCSLGRLRHISVQSLAPMIPQSFFSIIYRTACGPASSRFRHYRWHNPERELLRWAA